MNVRSLLLAFASVLSVGSAALGQTQPVTLEWDQSLEPSLAGYVVYVGNASGTYDEQHDVGLRTSFVYTNAVPGRPYYFSVAGYTPGRNVGPRSEEVLFLTGTGVVPSFRSPTSNERLDEGSKVAPASSAGIGGGRAVCVGDAICYRLDTLAVVAGTATDLTRTPDGRVLFVENERHVRAIEGDLLVPEPLLSAGRSETFAGLVIDPGFVDTRFAYVGVVETAPDGDRQLRIVRYRELANVFGEGAALVVGLSLPSEGRPSLSVDDARRLYVAMPMARTSEARPTRYGGMLLRFEGDGTTVRDDGAGAPVFSLGYADPASLTWSGVGNRLWLAGKGADWFGPLARLSLNSLPGGSAAVPESVAFAGDAVTSLTRPEPSSGRGADPEALVLVDEVGGVFRIALAPGGIAATPWIAPNDLGDQVVAAIGSVDTELHLVVRNSSGPGAVSSRIVRLRRR